MRRIGDRDAADRSTPGMIGPVTPQAGTSQAGTSAPETVRAGDAAPSPPVASGPFRGRRLHALLAGLTGLVAVVCALALPFAPLSVNEPTVSWRATRAVPSRHC